MNFDHWIMPLVQYATQKPGQSNKGKWKLSNLINNKCEKTKAQGVKKLSFWLRCGQWSKATEKKTNHHQRCFENQDRNTFFLGFDFQNEIAADFDHLFMLVTRGVIQNRCLFSGVRSIHTDPNMSNKKQVRKQHTKKRSTKNWTPSSVRASHRFPFGDNAQVQTEWSIRKST